jgi:hypothetical protein
MVFGSKLILLEPRRLAAGPVARRAGQVGREHLRIVGPTGGPGGQDQHGHGHPRLRRHQDSQARAGGRPPRGRGAHRVAVARQRDRSPPQVLPDHARRPRATRGGAQAVASGGRDAAGHVVGSPRFPDAKHPARSRQFHGESENDVSGSCSVAASTIRWAHKPLAPSMIDTSMYFIAFSPRFYRLRCLTGTGAAAVSGRVWPESAGTRGAINSVSSRFSRQACRRVMHFGQGWHTRGRPRKQACLLARLP